LTATQDSEIVLLLTVPFSSNLDGNLILRYYINNSLIDEQTVRKYFEKGDDVLSVCTFFPIKQEDAFTLKITLETEYFESSNRKNSARILAIENYINTGTYSVVNVDTTTAIATIKAGAVRSIVLGANLVIDERWDGTITVEEAFTNIELDNMPVVGFEDSVSISKLMPNRSEITESFGFIAPTVSIVGIRDNMIVNEVVDNYTFNTEKAGFYDYDSERVTAEGVFALNTAYSDAQIVTSNAISLEHSSILGIESAKAICTGILSMAISTDYKVTWKAHNGTEWLTLSDNYSGMSKEQLEAITVDQWNELMQGVDKIYIRIALTDVTQSVEEIVINFAN
jgi:hypothetical protein